MFKHRLPFTLRSWFNFSFSDLHMNCDHFLSLLTQLPPSKADCERRKTHLCAAVFSSLALTSSTPRLPWHQRGFFWQNKSRSPSLKPHPSPHLFSHNPCFLQHFFNLLFRFQRQLSVEECADKDHPLWGIRHYSLGGMYSGDTTEELVRGVMGLCYLILLPLSSPSHSFLCLRSFSHPRPVDSPSAFFKSCLFSSGKSKCCTHALL